MDIKYSLNQYQKLYFFVLLYVTHKLIHTVGMYFATTCHWKLCFYGLKNPSNLFVQKHCHSGVHVYLELCKFTCNLSFIFLTLAIR